MNKKLQSFPVPRDYSDKAFLALNHKYTNQVLRIETRSPSRPGCSPAVIKKSHLERAWEQGMSIALFTQNAPLSFQLLTGQELLESERPSLVFVFERKYQTCLTKQ